MATSSAAHQDDNSLVAWPSKRIIMSQCSCLNSTSERREPARLIISLAVAGFQNGSKSAGLTLCRPLPISPDQRTFAGLDPLVRFVPSPEVS
jgi:hypothetical protein